VATHVRYSEALRFEFAVRLNGLMPKQCGKAAYQGRAYPRHALLTHPFEMGLMLWL
jgi:starch phosphorylase